MSQRAPKPRPSAPRPVEAPRVVVRYAVEDDPAVRARVVEIWRRVFQRLRDEG